MLVKSQRLATVLQLVYLAIDNIWRNNYTSLACGSSGKFLAYSEQQDWDNHWEVRP